MDKLPLSGIRVLDFSHVFAGPACTRILADLGAEVIKVEGPGRLDVTRTLPWAMHNEPSAEFWNESAYFQNRNQGKLGIAVDLGRQEARELMKLLATQADVIVENFTPRVMRNFGLDYETLSALNPRLVMVSMGGYGGRGPYSHFVATGMSLNAASGLTSGTGYADGGPMKSGTQFCDGFAGVTAAGGVMAALLERERTGEGQWLDLSQQEVAMTAVGGWLVAQSRTGREPLRRGNRSDRFAPQGIYPCSGDDNWIYVSVRSSEEWARFCTSLGVPDWVRSADFANLWDRLENHNELDRRIRELTPRRDKFEFMAELQDVGIIAAAVLNGAEVLENVHLRARGAFEMIYLGVPAASYPSHRYVAARFSRFTPRSISRAPKLGEHNREVLQSRCDVSDDQYQRLQEEGVIDDQPRFQVSLDDTRAALRYPTEFLVRVGALKPVSEGTA